MLGFDGTRAAGLVLAYLLHSVVAVIQLTNGVDGVMYPYSYHEPTDLKSQGCNGKVPVIFHLGGMGIFRQAGEDVISNVCGFLFLTPTSCLPDVLMGFASDMDLADD